MTLAQARLFIEHLHHLEREKQRHIEEFCKQYAGVIGKRKERVAELEGGR